MASPPSFLVECRTTLNDKMTKAKRLAGANFRDFKAAALDSLVKQEQASRHASLAAKTARLKALRLARDAAEQTDVAPKTKDAAAEK